MRRLLRLRGDWPAAEAQAIAACEELHDFDRSITASGHYEIGEIRRRRGNFAGAEESYGVANEMGRDPQPGLSLLRLAEGKVDAAVAGITRALENAKDPLSRLRRLPAQVEVAIAAGDLKTARAAADETERIVDSYKIGDRRAAAFDAIVHFSRGQILLAEKDWDGAVEALRRARDEWQGVGAPYETAKARMLLGTAYRRGGDEHAGNVELEGALATFERLGAGIEEAQRQRAPRPRRDPPDVPVHGHRRLDEAAGHARRRQVEAPAGAARRARAREHRGERRRGREANGRRLLRVLREPEGRDRGGRGDPARPGRRDRGARRSHRRALSGGVPHRFRGERLRRPGRARRRPNRRARPEPARSSSAPRRSTVSMRHSGSPSHGSNR